MFRSANTGAHCTLKNICRIVFKSCVTRKDLFNINKYVYYWSKGFDCFYWKSNSGLKCRRDNHTLWNCLYFRTRFDVFANQKSTIMAIIQERAQSPSKIRCILFRNADHLSSIRQSLGWLLMKGMFINRNYYFKFC